jgi:hypothetical protein
LLPRVVAGTQPASAGTAQSPAASHRSHGFAQLQAGSVVVDDDVVVLFVVVVGAPSA